MHAAHINETIFEQALFFIIHELHLQQRIEQIEKEKYLNKVMSQILGAKKENSKLPQTTEIDLCVHILVRKKLKQTSKKTLSQLGS